MVLRRSGPTCKEVRIGTLQVDKALLQAFRIGVCEPAVFLALLPPGHQCPGSVVVEPWDPGKVATFIDRQNLVPDKATRASILDELPPDMFRRFYAVFQAHASLHRRLDPSLLVCDVAPHGRCRDVPDAANVVASAPQRGQLGAQMPEFLSQDARGIPLELAAGLAGAIPGSLSTHDARSGMTSIVCSVALSSAALLDNKGLQAFCHWPHQHRLAVFRAEYEVVVEGEDCASVACIPVMFHTTSIAQCSMNNNYLTRERGKGPLPARATSHSPVC